MKAPFRGICNGIAFLFIILSACNIQSFAQESFQKNPEADEKFEKGIELFQKKNYKEAYVKFNYITATLPLNQRTTASYIMAAKALYNTERFSDAVEQLQTYLKDFPDSKFQEEAHFLLGKSFSGARQYLESIREFLFLLEHKSEHYKQESFKRIEHLCMQKISLKVLEQIAKNDEWKVSKPVLLYFLMRKQAELGDVTNATILLDSLKKLRLDSELEHSVKSFSIASEKIYRIGVLLPLSESSEEEIGKEVLNGIKFGFTQSQNAKNKKVRLALEVKDTKHEPLSASLKTEEFASDSSMLAILGPLFSDVTLAAAKTANLRSIPLLSPTASADEITTSGKYVFQLTPSYSTQGMALAAFAAKEWKVKNVAILSSNDTHARSCADGFAEKIKKSGGKVLAEEYFSTGAVDIKEQMKALAASNKNGALDAILVSLGASSDMGIIAAQIKYYNLRVHILGNADWNDKQALLQSKREANNIYFCNDYFEHSPAFELLSEKLGKKPSKYFIYGYDSWNLLNQAIAQGASREEIKTYLSKLKNSKGLHTGFSFNSNQINQSVHIFQFSDGEIKMVDEVLANEK